MDSPGPAYYKSLRSRLGSSLSEPQYAALERFGVLADRDEADGVLLQIFTKPVGDRATLFLEVIQVELILNRAYKKLNSYGWMSCNFNNMTLNFIVERDCSCIPYIILTANRLRADNCIFSSHKRD